MLSINEVINVINNITDLNTIKLVIIYLKSTFFSFQDVIYEQTCGVAIGSPFSPIVANIFMEDFEAKSISSTPFLPKIWKRYVDNTFIIWPNGREKLDIFKNHFSNQSKFIKFTLEIEVHDNIPFLDVLITNKENGSILHQVFRKKTYIEQYLYSNSHHHATQKFDVLNTLATRALRIYDDIHISGENVHLLEVFISNGNKIHQRLKAFQKVEKGKKNG